MLIYVHLSLNHYPRADHVNLSVFESTCLSLNNMNAQRAVSHIYIYRNIAHNRAYIYARSKLVA
jgi:hypothetical protein